jgi:hypothetical protein
MDSGPRQDDSRAALESRRSDCDILASGDSDWRESLTLEPLTLPSGDRAVVDERKVRDYLLSLAHPVGRFKARFFTRLGYTAEEWWRLLDDILAVAKSGTVAQETEASYGRKFEVDGALEPPTGRPAEVRTVWIVRAGEDFPRLVTVFPR